METAGVGDSVIPIHTTAEILSLVYVRERWSDPWQLVPLMEAIVVGNQAAPAHATAELTREYGMIEWPIPLGTRPADADYTHEPPSDLCGWYVRVTTAHWHWYGQIVDREDKRDGDIDAGLGDGPVASGTETYSAFGLTYLLDKMLPIRGSAVYDHLPDVRLNRTKLVGKAFTFNGGWFDGTYEGNKYHYDIPNDLDLYGPRFATGPLHADDNAGGRIDMTGDYWTAAEALHYLFYWFSPRDKSGAVLVKWSFTGALAGLTQIIDRVSPEGMTLWQFLNHVLPPGKGFGLKANVLNSATVVVAGDGSLIVTESPNPEEEVELEVFTSTPVPITLPGTGAVIPANLNQGALLTANFINVTQENVTDSGQQVYQQVRVIGSYRGSVCTLAKDYIDPDDPGVAVDPIEIGESLSIANEDDANKLPVCETGWFSFSQEEYNVARTGNDVSDIPHIAGDPDFSSLSSIAKAERNTLFRRQDSLRDVFARWVISPDWTRRTTYNDGSDNPNNTATKIKEYVVFPGIDLNGDFDADVESYQLTQALVVADYLPMMAHVDYSGRDQDGLDVGVDQTAVFGDLLAPQFWWKYELAEQMDAKADLSPDEERQWNVQVRLLDDQPGFEFRVAGGHQHYIAADLYTPGGSFESISVSDHAVDHDDWAATVYLISQERLTAVWPADVDLASADQLAVFEHEMEGHLDYLVPGTIIGVDWVADPNAADPDARFLRYKRTTGGVLRDDRFYMLDTARLIFEWVGRPRQILEFGYSSDGPIAVDVGFLITAIGGGAANPISLNSVVTFVSINLKTGAVTMKTSVAELEIGSG